MSRARTVEWLTPPEIIAALGSFDLDPCTPIVQPYPTAARRFTVHDNGLIQRWPRRSRVWLNPPYTQHVLEKWLARMAEHDFGTALIPASTGTSAFARYVWECAAALLFIRGRLNFYLPDGSRSSDNFRYPTVLCAYGVKDADVLAGCSIDGQFVPLRIPRSVLVSAIADQPAGTWPEELAAFFASREPGPVGLAEIYRAFAGSRKARSNRNFDAKLRQQLQRGPYRRVSRGLWEAVA